MSRQKFSFQDFSRECRLQHDCHEIDGRGFGLRVFIPEELKNHFPYNSSAYDFLQFFREEIFQYGTIEFPGLAVNRQNHTVALRAPKEHSYSDNPFLTEPCQRPHQDTPPYPTAFWLDAKRNYFATWVMGEPAMESFFKAMSQHPGKTLDDLHRLLVPQSLEEKTGILLNHAPGLLLIDNSRHHNLYHARTCLFDKVKNNPDYEKDSPLYAFNEVGLMSYIDTIDSRRGQHDRNTEEARNVQLFMQQETLSGY